MVNGQNVKCMIILYGWNTVFHFIGRYILSPIFRPKQRDFLHWTERILHKTHNFDRTFLPLTVNFSS